MMLEEARVRLKKTTITEEQLWGINSLYILLDLDKDDFCKIIDAVGIEVLLKKRDYYENLEKAQQALQEKQRYEKSVRRLSEIEYETEELREFCRVYETKYILDTRL